MTDKTLDEIRAAAEAAYRAHEAAYDAYLEALKAQENSND